MKVIYVVSKQRGLNFIGLKAFWSDGVAKKWIKEQEATDPIYHYHIDMLPYDDSNERVSTKEEDFSDEEIESIKKEVIRHAAPKKKVSHMGADVFPFEKEEKEVHPATKRYMEANPPKEKKPFVDPDKARAVSQLAMLVHRKVVTIKQLTRELGVSTACIGNWFRKRTAPGDGNLQTIKNFLREYVKQGGDKRNLS